MRAKIKVETKGLLKGLIKLAKGHSPLRRKTEGMAPLRRGHQKERKPTSSQQQYVKKQ